MILLYSLAAFVALALGVHVLEALTHHGRLAPLVRLPALKAAAYRLGGMLFLFSVLTSLSGRPWHSAFVVFVVCAIVLVVSIIKRRILAEPLVLTDFYLVKQAIANPRLYYLDVLGKMWAQVALVFGLAVLVMATLAWFSMEPSQLHRWVFLVVALLVLAASLFYRKALGQHARALLALPDAAAYGLLATVMLAAFARCGVERPSASALHKAHNLPRVRSDAAPLVIALQLESFVDVQERGVAPGFLPSLSALQQESLMHGRLTVPAEGAYTMRTEAAVLTGLAPDDLGVDATDPYLALDRYTVPTLPSRFAQAGYRTVFLHPHDPHFFRRNKVIPALGFEHFISGDDFQDSRRYGPYVCDAALGEAIINLAYQFNEPLFIVAVTLENHGPWQKGRLEGIDDPVEQYFAHLRHTDAMLGDLHRQVRALGRETLICAWGDHVPARTLPLELGNRLETDYFLWSSRASTPSSAAVTLHAHDLTRLILGQA